MGDFTLARKNEIFAGNQATTQRAAPIEGVMRQDVLKELGWEVPVDVAPLPSQGVVYPKSSGLHGKQSVEIKSMTAKEEDILMSRAYNKMGTTITELIRSCLIDKTFDPADLLIGDRQALIVAIRVTGYGQDYKCDVNCGACDKRGTDTFDLSTLEVENIKVDPVTPGVNEFEVILPISKKRVIIKFMTGRDEEELSTTVERRRKIFGDQAENTITSRLAHQIISIDGVTDKNKINMFAINMPARDSKFLRDFVSKNEPGLKMRVPYRCSHCGETSEVALPLGANFFWPQD